MEWYAESLMSGDSSIVAKGDISANVFNSIDLGGSMINVPIV